MKENKTLKHLIETLKFIPWLVLHIFLSWGFAVVYVITMPINIALMVILLILYALTKESQFIKFLIDKSNDFTEFLLNGVMTGAGFNEDK